MYYCVSDYVYNSIILVPLIYILSPSAFRLMLIYVKQKQNTKWMYLEKNYWVIDKVVFEKYNITSIKSRAVIILPVCCQTGPSTGVWLCSLNFLNVLCEIWQTRRLSTTLQEVLKEPSRSLQPWKMSSARSFGVNLRYVPGTETCPHLPLEICRHPCDPVCCFYSCRNYLFWGAKPWKHCSRTGLSLAEQDWGYFRLQ